MKDLLEGFRNFLFRGNVVELAVAVIIGAAFGSVVTGFTKSFIEPLIKLLFGSSDPAKALEGLGFGPFPMGVFLAAVLNFLIIASVLYFLVIRPFGRFAAQLAAHTAPPEDLKVLREIRDLLKEQTRKE